MVWLRSVGIEAPAHSGIVPSGVHGRLVVAKE
jgi:hypothetical protein